MGSASDVQVPAQNSEWSDRSLTITVSSKHIGQVEELHSVFMQSQVAQTALVEGQKYIEGLRMETRTINRSESDVAITRM